MLNKARCDFIYRSHLYAHNFININDPSCVCGYRSQTTGHLFFNCPLTQDLKGQLLSDLSLLPKFNTCYNNHARITDRVHCLLFGIDNLSYESNCNLIKIVCTFLVKVSQILNNCHQIADSILGGLSLCPFP